MYHVSVDLWVSERGFEPSTELTASPYFLRVWTEGELVTPQATKRFKDSGVLYQLLREHPGVDWVQIALPRLQAVAELLRTVGLHAALPVPLLEIILETDGTDFPPFFLGRPILGIIQSMGAEVDVDIMNSLPPPEAGAG